MKSIFILMDEIDLDTRDRRNLYSRDVANVVAVEVSVDEMIDIEVGDALNNALVAAHEAVVQRGQRFAYVVIKVCR